MGGLESAAAEKPSRYHFDGTISREVLESYLARSLNMLGLSGSTQLAEDVRMIKNVGAKFIGRVALIWWEGDVEVDIETHFSKARELAQMLHKEDPEMLLEAGVFETVSAGMDTIPIPAWVFAEFGLKPENRNFDHRKMIYDDGYRGHGHGCLPPDISKMETRLWFYYCCRRYLDCGYEVIHLGMIGHMDRKDPGHAHWFDVLGRLRRYAKANARRHLILLNSQHSPGIVENGRLLLDMHQMQLRPVDVVGSPEKCVLRAGYGDTIFGRSAGGVTPSGWKCDHLPYYIQFDNGYATGKAGQHVGFPYAWGSCEIDWFARQEEDYRNAWLRYAWDWLRKNDPSGWLQMPGLVCLSEPLKGTKGRLSWYRANTRSEASPDGFSQERTIKAIWKGHAAE
ncbi:MAG TPA: hypothetical protein VNE39_17025 [Planctomycetota bacterium]|nr:hypothetical protein [Planctomycetota bacterium]